MFSNLRQVFLRHRWAIILAVLASIIASAPQIYFRIDHRDDGIYKGIEMIPDSPWSARAREAADGNEAFGSIYYKDGKDDPYLHQPLGSIVVAYMGKVFSFDINNTILLSRIVLTPIVFLLIYFFIFYLSRDKLLALAATSLFVLAESMLSLYGLKEFLTGNSPDSFLRITRPVNPAMIYVFFFSSLVAFYNFYLRRGWKLGILSAVLIGLNFYNYFYSWTYIYGFLGILVLIFFFQRKWDRVREIILVIVGSIFVAIPYIINLYNASFYPTYDILGVRHGIVFTHAPLFVGFSVIIALVIFLVTFYKDSDKDKFYFGLALLLTPFITLNQQILTGKVMQEDHYHWFFHKPMAVFFVLVAIFYLLEKRGWEFYKKVLATIIILVSISVGIYVQAKSYVSDPRDGGQVAIERQKYGSVMDWLNENGRLGEVVLANDEASHVTVIYTPLDVFYHRAGMYTLAATNERLAEQWYMFYRLEGVEGEDARDFFFKERGRISAYVFGMQYRENLGAYELIPDEKVEEFYESYEITLRTPKAIWIKEILEKYEVNYILWDKNENPDWNLDQYDFLDEAVEFGDIAIYKLKN